MGTHSSTARSLGLGLKISHCKTTNTTKFSRHTTPVEIGHVFEDGLKGLVEARENLNVIFAKLLVHLLQVLRKECVSDSITSMIRTDFLNWPKHTHTYIQKHTNTHTHPHKHILLLKLHESIKLKKIIQQTRGEGKRSRNRKNSRQKKSNQIACHKIVKVLWLLEVLEIVNNALVFGLQ